jgi:ERCC4-type nuclease
MVTILIDDREQSKVRRYLDALGADIVIQRMPVGDVQISHDCAFELKIHSDFLKSIIGENGDKLDVLAKCRDLAEAYKKPALLVGGSIEDILTERRINKNAIMAVLQAIMWNGCPVRFLVNEEIAANYIFAEAKKQQGEDAHSRDFQPHGKRSNRSPDEQKHYTVASINDCGPTQATNLLKAFGNIKHIANAELEELMEVPLIGKETALAIRENLQGVFWGKK